MRSPTRPISLLLTTLFLSLIFTNPAWAFECTNAGAGGTANDSNSELNTACGSGAMAEGFTGTAVGATAVASGAGSTAVGVTAFASGGNSTALGVDAAASGDNNTALGVAAFALSPHSNATALGYRAQVEQSNAMVLGSIPGVNEPFGSNEYVDVGIGTTTPGAPLHVERANGTARVQVTETQPGPSMPFQGVAQGLVRFELNDEAAGKRWRFTNAGTKFAINQVGVAGTEFQVFETGDVLITGSLTQNSDVNAKQDIVPVDRHDVLAKIARLPIAEWSYKDTPEQRHVGPMAQDFHAAFGLGRNNKGISTLDSSGVALAGIQALAEENDRLSQENRALQERLGRLESQQAQLQEVVLQMQDEQRARQVLTSTALN
jgi:hypothetical protein